MGPGHVRRAGTHEGKVSSKPRICTSRHTSARERSPCFRHLSPPTCSGCHLPPASPCPKLAPAPQPLPSRPARNPTPTSAAPCPPCHPALRPPVPDSRTRRCRQRNATNQSINPHLQHVCNQSPPPSPPPPPPPHTHLQPPQLLLHGRPGHRPVQRRPPHPVCLVRGGHRSQQRLHTGSAAAVGGLAGPWGISRPLGDQQRPAECREPGLLPAVAAATAAAAAAAASVPGPRPHRRLFPSPTGST